MRAYHLVLTAFSLKFLRDKRGRPRRTVRGSFTRASESGCSSKISQGAAAFRQRVKAQQIKVIFKSSQEARRRVSSVGVP